MMCILFYLGFFPYLSRPFSFGRDNVMRQTVQESNLTTQGNSDSLDGEETGFTGEERRLDGALFSDAPKEIRTPVSGLKGLRPSPLDDGGVFSGRILSFSPLTGQAAER